MVIKVQGKITKLDVKFAYVNTEKGVVFVPLAAAVPATEDCPNLRTKYHLQQLVQITAELQSNPRNNCPYLASKMRAIKQKVETEPSSSMISPKEEAPEDFIIAAVITVSDSFCYAKHELHGDIFVPGGAFGTETTRALNSYLTSDSWLLLKIQRQPPTRNCHWLAIEAAEHIVTELPSAEIKSIGKVVSVNRESCQIHNEVYEIKIDCPSSTLAWDDPSGAPKDLRDVINIGDYIMYGASFTPQSIVCLIWKVYKPKVEREKEREREMENPSLNETMSDLNSTFDDEFAMLTRAMEPKSLSEAFTQTNTTFEHHLLTCVLRESPHYLLKWEKMLHNLPRHVLPLNWEALLEEERLAAKLRETQLN